MNTKQNNMYWAEWGHTYKALRGHAWTPKAAAAKRKEIHAQAGAFYRDKHPKAGQVKSSKDLNNKELTNVLGFFWSWSQDDNLKAQMRQVAQTRVDFVGGLLTACGVERAGWQAYVDGVAMRIHKKKAEQLDDLEWADVVGALNHTRLHKQGIAHTHRGAKPAAPASQEPELPVEADEAEYFDEWGYQPAATPEDDPY